MGDDDGKSRSLANYVFLGAFLGSLVGTTIVLLNLADSSEEKQKEIRALRQELLKPVSAKLASVVDDIGESFRRALENISQ